MVYQSCHCLFTEAVRNLMISHTLAKYQSPSTNPSCRRDLLNISADERLKSESFNGARQYQKIIFKKRLFSLKLKFQSKLCITSPESDYLKSITCSLLPNSLKEHQEATSGSSCAVLHSIKSHPAIHRRLWWFIKWQEM